MYLTSTGEKHKCNLSAHARGLTPPAQAFRNLISWIFVISRYLFTISLHYLKVSCLESLPEF